MALDAVDTVKSTFGSLTTGTGLKIIGLLFIVQLANMAGSMMFQAGTAMAIAGGLLTLLAVIASILISVGAFRSLAEETLEQEQYTSNILWPLTRLLGAYIVTAVFSYGVGLLALLPLGIVSGLMGAGLGAGVGGASALVGLLGLLTLVIGLAAFVYVFLSLVVSLPMVAAEDNRLFQALDRSVQRTRGNRRSMFLAGVPLFLLYIAGAAVIVALGPGPQSTSVSPVYAAVTALVTSVIGTAFFSLLNEYNQRLPR